MKKTTAVKKAAKTPTAATLQKEISSDTRREASLKHDAATAKSAGTRKHDEARAAKLGKTVKSLKHQLASKSSGTKKRTWSPDADVGLCVARAVAESRRLSLGVCLTHDDVLGLHWAAGGDRETGACLSDVLSAAQSLFGQRGYRGIQAGNLPAAGAERLKVGAPFDGDLPYVPYLAALAPAEDRQPRVERPVREDLFAGHALILGLDLPWGEPHAVTVAPDGTWWSWGEPHSPDDFPGAVIEEAWAVTW